MKRFSLLLFFLLLVVSCQASTIPIGTVIHYSPAASGNYIGDPQILILPDGSYLASHCYFNFVIPGYANNRTFLYKSTDKGQSWQFLIKFTGLTSANLFQYRNKVYLMGITGYVRRQPHAVTLRYSSDSGKTWSSPIEILKPDLWNLQPMPFLIHNGRLYHEIGLMRLPCRSWLDNATCVISAQLNSNLMSAASWSVSKPLFFDPAWYPKGTTPGWSEGNILEYRGKLFNILRVNSEPQTGVAAITSFKGESLSFNPKTDFISLPGGMSKFAIRYDSKSRRYWSICNPVGNPANARQRNIVALVSSADLRNWKTHCILFVLPGDDTLVGAHYFDWQFDGNDIIGVCRFAWKGAHSYHDVNYFTFHRFKNFRQSNR
jgi:hypothetical protein